MKDRTLLYIIRHGETQWNIEGRWQGHLDSPLTPKGIKQAQAVATTLTRYEFSTIYTSDLGRAFHTAEIIAAETKKPLVSDRRLREWNLGIFQGMTKAEMQHQHADAFNAYQSADKDFVMPGGESVRQSCERGINCLTELAREHTGDSIVIVTHGGILNGVFRHAVGLPLNVPRTFKLSNASLNIFCVTNDLWQLETFGDVTHLRQVDVLDELH